MARRINLSTAQVLAIGFGIIILIGTLLLMLPISNHSGQSIPFLNALFTATSATCVTGLVVYDTAMQFTFFGQLIIILLIQIGGLGFMTIAIMFSIALGKRIGLKERSFLMEASNLMQIGGVVRLIRRVLYGTFILEAVGAILLSLKFCPLFGIRQGIWYGIFHSISAFCNAGFDLMGQIAPYASLTSFVGDLTINIVIMGLVIIGGIGFVVWDDIIRNKFYFRKYDLHTKIILATTGIVILVSSVLFFLIEKDATFSGMSTGERILAAFFQAVTPRTAGFNTVDTAALSEGGTLLTMLLMFVGAGPGSTAGGIKITTFIVLLLSVVAYVRHQEDINIFQRRLKTGLIRRAYCSAAFYLLLVFLGCLVILFVQNLPIKDVMFEVFSAIGTVGLSTGITRELSDISRLIIILLMYSGRLGSLTVFMAVAENRHPAKLKNSTGKIIIG